MTLPHVVVVGAGVFGIWTAWHLRAAGARVTVIEAYEPGHSRASSGGESRIIRCGYGTDEVYSRFALRSLRLWRELSSEIGGVQRPLFYRCGVLWLAAGADSYTEATRRTLESGGYPVQVLDPAALADRYPQLRADDVAVGLLEPDCGVIMARQAVAEMAARLEKQDTSIVRARVDAVHDGAGPLRSVRLGDGTDLRAEAFVFACGPWLPRVFPELLGGAITPTRQVEIFFGPPPSDDRFGPRHTPAWVDFQAGIYGVPDLEGRGLKVGIDRHGALFDPDTDDRTLDAESIAMAREWLARRVPAMAAAPVVEGRVCQYENTSTGDFLIDRHPERDNVWIVGGGSGHGFKHGPAIGEYVARLITEGAEAEPRFALHAHSAQSGRAVY